MARILKLLMALALLAAGPVVVGRAEAREIEASTDGVTIRAEATPVSQILDELARQAGVRVIYDGPPPQDLVTVDRHSATLAEAIPALLEGLGLNYVVKLDDTGTRIDTLFLAGRAGTASPLPAASGPASSRTERMRRMIQERRSQMREQAPVPDEFAEEPVEPFDDEEPPPDSFTGAVADAQEAAQSEEAPPAVGAPPAPPISPASPFTPSPFTPAPAGATSPEH